MRSKAACTDSIQVGLRWSPTRFDLIMAVGRLGHLDATPICRFIVFARLRVVYKLADESRQGLVFLTLSHSPLPVSSSSTVDQGSLPQSRRASIILHTRSRSSQTPVKRDCDRSFSYRCLEISAARDFTRSSTGADSHPEKGVRDERPECAVERFEHGVDDITEAPEAQNKAKGKHSHVKLCQ